MFRVGVTKVRFKNHWDYYKWRYVGALLVACLAWGILYGLTVPGIPANQKIDIFMVGSQFDINLAEDWETEILAALPADQKQVSIVTNQASVNGDPITEQLIMAMAIQKEGNIFILPKAYYESFMDQGLFMPMDVPQDGGKAILETIGIPKEDIGDEGFGVAAEGPYKGEDHVYAIPAKLAPGIGQLVGDEDMYISIVTYSRNLDNALRAIQWILQQPAP